MHNKEITHTVKTEEVFMKPKCKS